LIGREVFEDLECVFLASFSAMSHGFGWVCGEMDHSPLSGGPRNPVVELRYCTTAYGTKSLD
jgi:hypothetical protein